MWPFHRIMLNASDYRPVSSQRTRLRRSFHPRRSPKPPVRFENLAGTKLRRLVTPDKKKYAACYRALNQHNRLEQKWHSEDQRNLHCLVNIRQFLWT